jgi:hypothetical protein
VWLFDTCSIINLSYCQPVAAVFRKRYAGEAGWVKAVQTELASQRARRPPHPQAGRAMSWATTWLGDPIVLDEAADIEATEAVRIAVAAGGGISALDHLGEAASIVALEKHQAAWAGGRLISDDRGARDEARRRGLLAASTVGVVARLLTLSPAVLTVAHADTYLTVLRERDRMHVPLTATDLLAGDIGPWE